MSTRLHLRLREAPPLRASLDGIVPDQAADAADVAHRALWLGNQTIELGELFDVSTQTLDGDAVPELVIEGDCHRIDGIGRGMNGGMLRIEGDVGDYLGAGMLAGEIVVSGSAGDLAACEMQGGRVDIAHNLGDFAASTLPGSMDGMRGGTLVVRGNVGARCADRMRRGTLILHGDAGEFLASRMVAGTVALAGKAGAHCGYGMRRGTLVFAGTAPAAPPTFVATHQDIVVFWTLLRRSLAYHGGRFAALPGRAPRRLVGDLAAGGKGEWLLPDTD